MTANPNDESVKAELRRRWEDLTNFVTESIKEKWWTQIYEHYANRPFHNLRRLNSQMLLFDEFKDQLKDRYAVAFAIFFKHLECDISGNEDCGAAERNVQRLHEFCSETTFDQENYVANLLTESAKNCTEAHLNEGEFGSEDVHYFIDFDTAWVGSESADYDRYASEIRKELSHMDDEEYRKQRLRVLQFFLQIPNIFATQKFRERFEGKASENIQREIEKLQSELKG